MGLFLVLVKSVQQFLCNSADKQTDTGENRTSSVEVLKQLDKDCDCLGRTSEPASSHLNVLTKLNDEQRQKTLKGSGKRSEPHRSGAFRSHLSTLCQSNTLRTCANDSRWFNTLILKTNAVRRSHYISRNTSQWRRRQLHRQSNCSQSYILSSSVAKSRAEPSNWDPDEKCGRVRFDCRLLSSFNVYSETITERL